MTDDNLALLGVPETNEVMYVNGKVAFRQYIAVLERSFWESNRSLSAVLEPNTLPAVNPEGYDIAALRKAREEAAAARAATGVSGTTKQTTTETTVDTTETPTSN